MKKILVFKIGALGDILMATPFLRELRNQNPKARIDFLVGDNCKAILEDNKFINNVIPFDQKIFAKKNLKGFYNLAKEIKKKKYHRIYILDKHWAFHVFASLTEIKDRIGLIRDPIAKRLTRKGTFYKWVRHEVDFYLSLLKNKETDKPNRSLHYETNKAAEKKVKDYLKRRNVSSDYVIFVNLGGNELEKSDVRKIPDKKFEELLAHISKKQQVLLVGGPSDKKYYDRFVLNKNCINTAGDFKIPETIAAMKYAKHIYTTDSGPMHFAACVNDNITCFFGPTNPKRKAPIVKNLKVIWKDQALYEEAYETHGKQPKKGKEFFKELSIKDL